MSGAAVTGPRGGGRPPRRLLLLGVLQWVGLLGGAGVWAAQHAIGWGIAQAACGAAERTFGIDHDLWQAATAMVSAALVLGALACAAVVFARTKGPEEGPPPEGRLHFLAAAALLVDVLLLVIIVLDGTASVVDSACVQA